ncbi:MAG: PKD domain-containing protein [Bacteroidota bacterium]
MKTVLLRIIGISLLSSAAYLLNAQSPTAPALDFNVFLKNGATLVSNETEGPVAMGGDLSLTGSYQVSVHNTGTFKVNGVTVSLLVGGKINYSGGNGIQVNNNGYVKVGSCGTSKTWYTDQNNAYSPIRITPGSDYNGSPRVMLSANSQNLGVSATNNPVCQGNLIDFETAFKNLQTNSSSLSLCTDNTTLTNPNGGTIAHTGLPNQVKITLKTGTNILNLKGTDMNNVQNFTYNNSPDATHVLIINVDAPGTYNWAAWTNGGVGFSNCPYILYNFYNTTTLNVQGNGAIEGTVMAPFANIVKTANQQNIEGQVIALSYIQNGGENHYAKFTPSVSGCAPVVNPTVAAFTTNSTAQCLSSNSFTFTNTSNGTAPFTYSWSFGDGTTSTEANPTKTYAGTGAYSVTLTTTGAGGTATKTSVVTVNAAPAKGFTASSVNMSLAANNFTFTSTNPAAGNTYVWSFGDGSTSAAVNPSKVYAATGTYAVKQVVSSGAGCKDSASMNVKVHANAVTIAGFSANGVEQCLGVNQFNFVNKSAGEPTLNYTWNFGDGTSSTLANPSKTYAAAGTYMVTLTASGPGGASSSSISFTVNPDPVKGFTVNTSTQILSGNAFVCTPTGAASQQYYWSFGDGTDSEAYTPTKTYSSAGTYEIIQNVTVNGKCKQTVSKFVVVEPNAPSTAAFSVNKSTQCASGNAFAFTNQSTGTAPVHYEWNFGDGGYSTETAPNHTYTTAGKYTVTLMVHGAGGSHSTSKEIQVIAMPDAGFAVQDTVQSFEQNQFVFQSHPQEGISHIWSFGDETTSNLANPVKSYLAAGTYTVSQQCANGECFSTHSLSVVVESPEVGSGSGGGLESESLGDLISKRDFNRIKTSYDPKVSYSTLPVFKSSGYTKSTAIKLSDMIPAELVPGNTLRVTSPEDLLDYTRAVDVLSVDYVVHNQAKAVVLGLKTVNETYNHTKSVCDRFRGGTMTAVEDVEIEGYHFSMFTMQQENGAVEYAVTFAVGEKEGRDHLTLQTNWIIRSIQADEAVYNMQVWATQPAYTKKLVADMIRKLNNGNVLTQVNVNEIPALYITHGERIGGDLKVSIFNSTAATHAKLVFEQKMNENAAYQLSEYPLDVQQGMNEFMINVQDGYEFNGSLYLEDRQTDQVYLADGGWSLDYDRNNTTVTEFKTTNDGARAYGKDDFALYRSAQVTASSNDYLILYRAIRSSAAQRTDLTAHNAVRFFAKGTGALTVKLTRDSIIDWRAQFKNTIQLDPKGREVVIYFDEFRSDLISGGLYAKDLTTIQFSHGTAAGSDAKEEIAFSISDVEFITAVKEETKSAGDPELKVGPSPFTSVVNCTFTAPQSGTMQLVMTDALGRTVAVKEVEAVPGTNQVTLNVDPSVNSGVMMITLRGNGTDYKNVKLIKD